MILVDDIGIFYISEYFWQMCCIHLKRTTPSVKNEKNMQTAPSARDDTVHKNIIPKRTAPSVNKLNYNKKRTTIRK